jgi:hypothetical protein
MGSPDVLDQLRDLGVTVTLDRPTGKLQARPRPVPDRARDLLRAHRGLIAAALTNACSVEDPVGLLLGGIGGHIVGELIPKRGHIGRGIWAPPRLPNWSGPLTLAPAQAVRLGAQGRRYGISKEIKDGKEKIRTTTLRHSWFVCDTCGEGVMRKKGAAPKSCMPTPRCPGKYRVWDGVAPTQREVREGPYREVWDRDTPTRRVPSRLDRVRRSLVSPNWTPEPRERCESSPSTVEDLYPYRANVAQFCRAYEQLDNEDPERSWRGTRTVVLQHCIDAKQSELADALDIADANRIVSRIVPHVLELARRGES